MTGTWLFAFVILPVSIGVSAYAAVRWYEWNSKRNPR